MSALQKKISYLRARDPSIRIRIFNVPRVLHEEISEHDEISTEESGLLDVYLRMKFPLENDHLFTINENVLMCAVPEDSQYGRNIDGEQLNKLFQFTKIFPSTSNQIELFDNVVKMKVLKCMNGANTNLLMYGPSGSGKTFTIVGTQDAPGMIPQSLEYLFRSMPAMRKFPVAKPTTDHSTIKWLNRQEQQDAVDECEKLLSTSEIVLDLPMHIKSYSDMQKRLSKQSKALLDEAGNNISIWISFAEIYNEGVYDLLEAVTKKARKKLKIYTNNGETYINGLKQVYASNGHDAYCILQYGLLNLNYAATALNSHSSRSHSIFTISLVQSTKKKSTDYLISRMSFCDLAGSERCKKTNNIGCRQVESNIINNSLLVLGRCISAIRKSQKNTSKMVIPFRESKLTQVFQKALQGEQDISMIVAINPERYMFGETLHALNFSAVAKDITLTKPNENSVLPSSTFHTGHSAEDYERKIDELQTKVEHLELKLWQQQQHEDEREHNVRLSLVEQFKKMFDKQKLDSQEEIARIRYEKDDIIEELQEELERYKEAEVDPENSVISISSSFSEGHSMREKIADLNRVSERCTQLLEENENLKHEKVLVDLKIVELTQLIQQYQTRNRVQDEKIRSQEELLKSQKLDIIRLQDEVYGLDGEVRRSIRYTNVILKEYEDEHSDNQSDDMSSL